MVYADRFDRLRGRRIPSEQMTSAKRESFLISSLEKDFSYLVYAMQPIDVQFTENTFREGTRVRDQLAKNLSAGYAPEFGFQGSVTSDTHIRIHSDIDLLALNRCFFYQDYGAPNRNPYRGNAMEELKSMRLDTALLLKKCFPAVHVDDSPGKSISMEGGSLNRKIDIIIGSWWNTELWKKFQYKWMRGISILDTKGIQLIRNKPFHHNLQIDAKDQKTGGLRKVIRLLKALKYDAESELKISSYDIAAISWNMSEYALTVRPHEYLQLAIGACSELQRFINNESVRNNLKVPNETRAVFCAGGATLESLRILHAELVDLIQRIEFERIISSLTSSSTRIRKTLPSWVEQRPQVLLDHSY